MKKILTIIILISLAFFASAGEAQAAYSGWGYKRPVTVTYAGSAQTNYAVKVTFNSNELVIAGKMRSDCGDLRFADSDDSTALSYWIESGQNTTSTVVWAKIPSIPTGGKTIYMYYGNSGQTDAGSGANTFNFFDDFPGTTLDGAKWTSTVSNGSVTVGSGIVNIIANSGGYAYIDSISAPMSMDKIWEARSNCSASSTNCEEYLLVGGGNLGWRQDIGGNLAIRDADTFGGYGVDAAVNSYIANYAIWGISWISSQQKWWVNYSNVLTDTNGQANASGAMRMQAHGGGGYHNNAFDWVRVRPYVSSEPTTSVGAEQAIVCGPILNQDWVITDTQTCDNVTVTTGTGKIRIQGAGLLVIQNNATVTTNDLWVERSGHAVYVYSTGKLYVQ